MEQMDELPPGISEPEQIPVYDEKPMLNLMEEQGEEEEEEDIYDDVNPLAGSDDDDDDDIHVTIGKIEPPINVQFNKGAAGGDRQVPAGKLDLDTVPMLNDKPIYDVDLATMEDRPWRKPGADITDYFNYGFTEDSWNTYCERQKKLRLEFTSQAAVNKAIFSNIHLANPLAMPSNVGGRQLVSLTDNNATSNVKVLTDNGGRFKPHYHKGDGTEPIVRTVIGGSTPAAAQPVPTSTAPSPVTTTPVMSIPNTAQPPPMDFSKPPPGMTLPPPGIPSISSQTNLPPPGVDAPPGIDVAPIASNVEGPPGVDLGPPGEQPIQAMGSGSMDMSMPPPGFNPAMPPPGLRPMGMPPTNMPPPVFNAMMPPPGFGMQPRYQQVGPSGSVGRSSGMMNRDYDGMRRESGDFEDRESEDERRRYRRRSRSRSPIKSRESRSSRRDERDDRRDRDRDRDRERDRDRDRGKERDRAERSRRHRTGSGSPENRKKRSDDRDKKRDRRDEDSDRKKSRKHDDDSKDKERSSRHSRRSEKSREERDRDDDSEPAPPGTEDSNDGIVKHE